MALIFSALPVLAQTQTAQTPKPPVGVWKPAAPVVPGVARVFYSPSTARVATWGLIAGSVIALVIIVWHLTWVASER